MGEILQSPKIRVVALTLEQKDKLSELKANYEAAFKRGDDLRNEREKLAQEISGSKDWEIAEDGNFITVRNYDKANK